MIKATLIQHMGDDLTVVNAARVSFGKKSEWLPSGSKTNPDGRGSQIINGKEVVLSQQDTKLIHYLAKHGHYSPFGHCFATFHIKAPIFVARQLVKHEYLRMNEISRRYVDSEPEFYVPDVWRGRAKDKKQGSDGIVNLDAFNTEGGRYEGYFGEGTLSESLTDSMLEALNLYDGLIAAGVAPEMARMVLPQSMYTEWFWSGSMDAFANMCALRLKEDTQYETRLVAQQVDEQMSVLYPVSWRALVHEQTS